jgi:uncharacterized phiE125 gp8 family phage protein
MTVDPIGLEVGPHVGSPEQDLAIPLELIRQHCAVDGSDLDELLTLYAQAALEWAEGSTHRAILARPHRWFLRDFPRGRDQSIRLPRGRTHAVAGISYVVNGAAVTLRGPTSDEPGSDYQEELRDDSGGVLLPARGHSWPACDYAAVVPVTIEFTAGWPVTDVPADIRHAMLFAIADMLELRGTSDTTALGAVASVGRTLETRETLVSGWRLARLY